MRKLSERDHAKCASERQATLQRKSTHECERMANETSEEREMRLQQMRDRPAAETLRREKEDYSRGAPTSVKGWQLKPPRREN